MVSIAGDKLNREGKRKALKSFKDLAKSASQKNKWGDWTLDRSVLLRSNCPPHLIAFYFNDFASVQVFHKLTDWGAIEQLAIRLNDGSNKLSWQDKQEIKNAIAGKERIAVEVFPKDSELIDDANIFWLWVLPENFSFPLNLH